MKTSRKQLRALLGCISLLPAVMLSPMPPRTESQLDTAACHKALWPHRELCIEGLHWNSWVVEEKIYGEFFSNYFPTTEVGVAGWFSPSASQSSYMLQARKKLPSLVVFKEQQPVSIPFIAAGALWAFLSSFPWVFLHHVLPCELTAHTAQWQCEFMQPWPVTDAFNLQHSLFFLNFFLAFRKQRWERGGGKKADFCTVIRVT